jgi:HSF-type DNA-binding
LTIMEGTASRKSNAAPAAFLEKLYDILEEVSLESYISWQPDGLSFLIRDVNSVSELVLPHYFKHNNIQSFVRQLNMYSFTKTRHDSNYREFRQPLFQRGRRDLLSLIKRKTQGSSDKNALIKRKLGALENDVEYKCVTTTTTDEESEDKLSSDGGEDDVCEEAASSSTCSSESEIYTGPTNRYLLTPIAHLDFSDIISLLRNLSSTVGTKI